MADSIQKIGTLIQEIRKDRGLTQAELARRLGTSQAAVNRIESGKQNLTLDTLGHISDVLKKPIIAIGDNAVNLRIEGGHSLSGEITCKTAKNSTVAILCASLLNKGKTTLKNVPRIEEVNRIVEVLSSIHVDVRWTGASDLEIKVPAHIDPAAMDKAAARKTRTVINLVGSLMHDHKSFDIPFAGGCKLGRRSVVPHSYALAEFGAKITTRDGAYHVDISRKIPDEPVVMYEMSDLATENAIVAAAGMPGETVIKQASANYMVQDVCFFLQKLGVKIEGIGTPTLRIHGQTNIKKNVVFSPSEDPVEAMTFISAAVTTNSSITVKRSPIDFVEFELLKLRKMGLRFEVSPVYKADNGSTNLADVKIHKHNGSLKAPEEKIHPLPGGVGINIDNLPYFIPIVASAKGNTLIHDWPYEERSLMFTEMKKLNVNMVLADPYRVFIDGPTQWRAADVVAPNGIRPAVVLLIGMLAAPGVSVLRNIYTINRGYEDLANRLNQLGANIQVMHDVS
ncbi:UDP-N-acetylglucosamine 1-carboxyvinyltransferase [Candidatus Saccharibacteria bacterium]|nr:MAG: UDP-N-acetylglucosamine 1-carboxyvinyltransferase [Candidatus Saccharibacteria bacterium]